jgi:uncharacterized protein involved in cysteine biosynthesis
MLNNFMKPQYEFYRFLVLGVLLISGVVCLSYLMFIGYPEARDLVSNWWLGVLEKVFILLAVSGVLFGIYYLITSLKAKVMNGSAH